MLHTYIYIYIYIYIYYNLLYSQLNSAWAPFLVPQVDSRWPQALVTLALGPLRRRLRSSTARKAMPLELDRLDLVAGEFSNCSRRFIDVYSWEIIYNIAGT